MNNPTTRRNPPDWYVPQKAGVDATARQQRRVNPFDDAAVVEDDEFIHAAHRRQPVCAMTRHRSPVEQPGGAS